MLYRSCICEAFHFGDASYILYNFLIKLNCVPHEADQSAGSYAIPQNKIKICCRCPLTDVSVSVPSTFDKCGVRNDSFRIIKKGTSRRGVVEDGKKPLTFS